MTFVRPLTEERRSALQSWVTHAEADVSLAKEWVTSRGLVYETCRRFRLGVVTSDHPSNEFWRYEGRLVLPGLGPNGVYSVRFRDLTGTSEQKMLGLPNTPVRPYNVQALHYAGDYIAITEGEMDALTLEQCGIPAVGFTGVSAWHSYSHRLFEGFRTVYVVADNDGPGIQFAEKVAKVVPQARIVVPGSDGDDCNSFYVSNGGWSGNGRSAIYDLLGLKEHEMAVAV